MKWEKGRQGTGYEKLKIFQFLNMDCYLLRYKVGDHIPAHVDPVPGRKHFRFNAVLKKAEKGGRLLILTPIFKTERFCFFRSDLSKHAVTEIKQGSRIVLTFGIAI